MGVRAKVKQIICEQFGVKEVKDEDKFIDSALNADELDMIEVSMAFEEKWGIDISDEEAEALVTVKDAIELVERKTK